MPKAAASTNQPGPAPRRDLLDVNVLIALCDPDHAFHQTAKSWFALQCTAWATCPLTQNGCLRIMSARDYSNPFPFAAVHTHLQGLCALPAHQFWPDDVSLLTTNVLNASHIHSSTQLTDVYLLALAVKNQGRLVTFDQRIPLSAVRGAKTENLVVVGASPVR
jgi:toxin-antitoxin system PIN domain toxin